MNSMSVEIEQKVVTQEEYVALGEDVRAEVVDGELIFDMNPAYIDHSLYAQRVGTYLDVFVSRHQLGRVFADNAAFRLSANAPNEGLTNTRVPDVSFVSFDRLPRDAQLNIIPTVAPDLAVEIISPTETHADILKKLRDYLDNGVRMVWHILPDLAEIHMFLAPDPTAIILRIDDDLSGADVIAGFEVPARAILDLSDNDLHLRVLRKLLDG